MKKLYLVTMMRNFLSLIKGIPGVKIKDIIEALDVRALGEKSKDVGHKTIMGFISTTYQSEVEKDLIQRFCRGIGYDDLGKKFNYLFSKADLKNIGYFLSYFNSLDKDQVFKWKLPNDIRFTIIDFPRRLKESSLVDVAHFVFNFYYIDRLDCCNRFALEIDKYHSFIISNSGLEEVSLENIEFFLWNLWMALKDILSDA